MERNRQGRKGVARTLLGLSLAGAASCATPQAPTITTQSQGSVPPGTAVVRPAETRLIDEGGPVYAKPLPPAGAEGARLINEGGPVYVIPGEIVVPTYFKGDRTELTVTAERLGGARVEAVVPAKVGADGRFSLVVPQGERAFFASTVFPQDELLVRLRTLVQPGADTRVVLDPLATLVTARISRTWLQGHELDLDRLAQPTAELISNLRAALPAAELNRVPLTGSNLDLARELSSLAGKRPDLDYALNAWEDKLTAFPLRPPEGALPPAGPTPGDVPK
ncbi:MAG: hypothetical protein VKS61_00305 [Candidatus Sericytochromatia bacterium]|nr:hypothetical protein [Candidatus Sericytochromatia bacterium]